VDPELALAWCLPGSEDLEGALASSGVVGGPLIRAMAGAHAVFASACATQHRRGPGAREARGWAGAAGALLQRGRPLADALWVGWRQAYIRGYAATASLAAEAHSAFCGLCGRMGLPCPPEAAAAPCAEAAAAAGAAAAAAAGAGLVEAWPQQLARPCVWPVPRPLARLSRLSHLAVSARDTSLLRWLLAQALGAEARPSDPMAAAPAAAAITGQIAALPAAQRALLPGELLAPQGAAGSLSRWRGAANVQLPALALAAAAALVCRAGPRDWRVRALEVSAVAADVEAAASALGGDATSGGTVALVRMASGLVSSGQAHPVIHALAPVLAAAVAGAPPLPAARRLLSCLSSALRHGAAQAEAERGAAGAVAAGSGSAFQLSFYRQCRPQERARRAPEHPVLDLLNATLTATRVLEAATLQQLAEAAAAEAERRGSSCSACFVQQGSGGDSGVHALAELQRARAHFWAAAHGAFSLRGWGACASEAPALGSAGSAAAAPVPCVERLAWAWVQMRKRGSALLKALPPLQGSDAAAAWQQLTLQMDGALSLDARPPKPLLWRLGGHPQLPRTLELVAAQRGVAALADALRAARPASGGGWAVFAVDARGRPAGLDEAGLSFEDLLHEAARRMLAGDGPMHAHADAMEVDGSGDPPLATPEVLLAELGPEAREELAAAVAAGLACDPDLRARIVEGAAMMGFLPTLLAGSGGTAAGAAGDDGSARAAQMPQLLRERAAQRALGLLLSALWQRRAAREGEGGGSSGVEGGGGGSGVDGVLPDGALLLSPAGMISSALRAMQLPLLQLEGVAAAADGAALLAGVTAWGLELLSSEAAAPGKGGALRCSALQRSAAAALLPAACRLLKRELHACVGSALDATATQQTVWLLQAVADGAPLPWEETTRQLLPALLHELWFRWQAGARALGSTAAEAAVAHAGAAPPAVGPVALHTAAQTAAVLQLLAGGAADVRTKGARLQQLQLAARHLMRQAMPPMLPHAGSGSPPADDAAAAAAWRGLRMLLAQLLLAHAPSMPGPEAVRRLHVVARALSEWKGAGSVAAAPASADELLSALAQLVASSSHTTLRDVAQPLLLPCSEAALTEGAAGASWGARLARLGHAWLLLGTARLQLVAPPGGVDPAGKYGLKRDALLTWSKEWLETEAQVRQEW
jgi:midasin